MSCVQKRRKAKKKHSLHKLLALSNEFILFTPGLPDIILHAVILRGTRLCNRWPHTYFSLAHITQTRPRTTDYPSAEHIENLSHMWQTRHLADPRPHLSCVRVCASASWLVCACDVRARWLLRVCVCVCVSLIKSVRQIICKEMRHGSPTKITHWTALWQSATVWRRYKIQCWARVCAGVQIQINLEKKLVLEVLLRTVFPKNWRCFKPFAFCHAGQRCATVVYFSKMTHGAPSKRCR